METLIAQIRPYVELLYFIGGVGLFVGVVISYRQLRLIQADIETRNRRAAKEKALEAANCYGSGFAPLSGKFFEEWRSRKLKPYAGPVGDFTADSIPAEWRTNSIERFKIISWLDALNQLNYISAMFVSDVADGDIGFKFIGRSMCTWVESNYDVISLCRREKAYPYWQCTVELYRRWRPKLQKAELEEMRDELSERLRSLDSE